MQILHEGEWLTLTNTLAYNDTVLKSFIEQTPVINIFLLGPKKKKQKKSFLILIQGLYSQHLIFYVTYECAR
jgi:hypothetical protein